MDDHDEHKEAHEKLVELARDRDEWKRRAEAAEARTASLEARIDDGYVPTIARYQRDCFNGEALRAWGLNPEAVREYDSLEDAMHAMGYVLDRCYERGPGIAATKDDGQWGATLEDLLADDAP